MGTGGNGRHVASTYRGLSGCGRRRATPAGRQLRDLLRSVRVEKSARSVDRSAVARLQSDLVDCRLCSRRGRSVRAWMEYGGPGFWQGRRATFASCDRRGVRETGGFAALSVFLAHQTGDDRSRRGKRPRAIACVRCRGRPRERDLKRGHESARAAETFDLRLGPESLGQLLIPQPRTTPPKLARSGLHSLRAASGWLSGLSVVAALTLSAFLLRMSVLARTKRGEPDAALESTK